MHISSDEDVTTTPSPTTTSSSPTPPNAPSKTTSTNQTSSSQENTSSSFQSKLPISPPSLNEPTSPHPLNPLLDNILDFPPRPLIRKDIKVKKRKNKQKPTRNEETSDQEERYQSRISPTQGKNQIKSKEVKVKKVKSKLKRNDHYTL
ncbi:hypothetical protein Tco_0938277 [Tanacetum coccineum]|uniref:Uncharacterized protein n=1 Tax=Tanacetum coccineum TaxID=301880 RepID=A0ABQ5DHE2_9ASTR